MTRLNKRRPRVRVIAGVRFRSTGDGHYVTQDGRYGIWHMMRGTPHDMWELYERADNGSPYGEVIDDAQTLGEIALHAERGRFKLDNGEQR